MPMDSIRDGVSRFRCDVFPSQETMYKQLAHDGQQPKVLVISCADSRVIPETITQSGPGEMFVCRNVGNIVPPFVTTIGGVSSAIEYAVVALDVKDIIICGHSDCGAMKALLDPGSLDNMPSVAAWLHHAHAACAVFKEAYPQDMDREASVRALAQENIVTQLHHLRTHPSVAAKLAIGQVNLHGWFFDLQTGTLFALDGEKGHFVPVEHDDTLPVAEVSVQRQVADYKRAPSRPVLERASTEPATAG